MGSSQDVAVSDERAATELPAVVEQSSNPGPLALVSRPAVHHPEGVLPVVVDPLLLLGHGAVAVVSDGVIFPTAAATRVAGAGPGGTLGRGGLVSHGDCARARAGGRNARGGTSSSSTGVLALGRSSSSSSWVLTLGRKTSGVLTSSWILPSTRILTLGRISAPDSRVLALGGEASPHPRPASSRSRPASSSAWPAASQLSEGSLALGSTAESHRATG